MSYASQPARVTHRNGAGARPQRHRPTAKATARHCGHRPEIGSERQQLWVDAIGQQLGTESWQQALRVSAVDTHSGAVSIIDAADAVPLSRAVAASCAVPGVFPSVDIDARNYTDAAIPTGTHAAGGLR